MTHTTATPLHVGIYCEFFLTDWSGAERMLAGLAQAMLARGHRATILARQPAGPVSPKIPLTPLPDGCGILQVDLNSETGRAAAQAAVLEADLDVLVAPCTKRDFLKALQLASDTGTPIVSAEAIHPAVLTHQRWEPYEHYGALAACDRIQVLLESFRAQYPASLRARIDVIGNPAPPPQRVDFAARAAKPKKTLLAIGRFDEVDKQFSLLLRTWALLFPAFPDWELHLVGDGAAWELYHAMVKAMGPEARAVIHGSVLDPRPFYEAADLFCMPSRQEGFGLVLAEAAAYSLPLVGLKSCKAAATLIPEGSGALATASTPAALAETLRPLMAAPPEERQRQGECARDFFQAHYAERIIYDRWEQTLVRAAAARTLPRAARLRRDAWNAVLLREAALEVLARPDPLAAPADRDGAAALARLRTEHAALVREHRALQKRYEALMRQAQSGGKRGR